MFNNVSPGIVQQFNNLFPVSNVFKISYLYLNFHTCKLYITFEYLCLLYLLFTVIYGL